MVGAETCRCYAVPAIALIWAADLLIERYSSREKRRND